MRYRPTDPRGNAEIAGLDIDGRARSNLANSSVNVRSCNFSPRTHSLTVAFFTSVLGRCSSTFVVTASEFSGNTRVLSSSLRSACRVILYECLCAAGGVVFVLTGSVVRSMQCRLVGGAKERRSRSDARSIGHIQYARGSDGLASHSGT